MAEHRLEIVQKFWADGYTCECSCGWRSEEMASSDAAVAKGRDHTSELPRRSAALPGLPVRGEA